MSIPRSRMEDNYDLDVSLDGYEMKSVTVKSGERMVKVALSPKQVLPEEFLSISPNVLIGHYLGLPQVDLEVTLSNLTINEVSVSDVILTVTPKDDPGERRILPFQYMYLAPGMASLGRPESRSVPKNGKLHEFYAFMEHLRIDIRQFNMEYTAVLSKIGPQNLSIGRRIISEEMTYALQHDMEARWFWHPGDYELEFSCTVDGKRFHATSTVQLSAKDVMDMKNIAKYYDSGYGLVHGYHYLPIGDAKPALTKQSNFVYTESE